MAKLQMLSFEDDGIIAQRIREESNYCDVAHLYVATYGIFCGHRPADAV